ncbi:hypothetical protein [Salibacterium aidingense]|uniref:hypothetical protein n=1 Tax=Salibacterium aidingense TaxID=384933 RepID=UPI003BBD5402
MKYFSPLLAFVVIMLTSCSLESENNGENTETSGGTSGSYQAWIRVNETVYQSQGSENNGKYTRDEKIGEVEYNLPADESIQENFASNYAEEDAAIYSIQEKNNILLVEVESGTYEIFFNNNE